MKASLRRLADWLLHRSPLTTTVIGLLMVLAIGLPDYFTPRSMTFTLFYFLAVIYVGWGAGRWPAFLVSVVVVITVGLTQWVMPRQWPRPEWIPVWNTLSRLAVFCLVGWVSAELARLTHGLRALADERTARWRAEAEEHKGTASRLAEAVERFEQVINNISEVFWLSNVAKDQMVYVSPGYERIWGRTCEELYRKPKSWLAAVHPEDRDWVARRAHTEQAGGGYDVEYRIIRPDGAVRWVRDRAFPVRNAAGEVCRVAGIADDITERKQDRETLRVQAAILENMAEGVVVTDEHGMILQTNRAADRLWGYERNELTGQPVTVLSALPEPERTANLQEVLRAMQATGSWRGTFEDKSKDGTTIYCDAVMSRLELQDRRLYVAVEQDVTERKRAEVARETFLWLGATLSTARNPVEAARAVYAAADRLWRWDNAHLDLYTAESDETQPVLYCDIIDGKRQEIAPPTAAGPPTARMRRIMAHGAQLILRKEGEMPEPGAVRYGDLSRISASILSVPLRREGRPVGVLSIQSYTRNAYTPEDLRTLQALADYCGGAVDRIRAEAALRESEESLRAFLDAVPMPAFLLDREGKVLVSNPALAERLSLPADQIKGRDAHALLPEEAGKLRRAIFDEVLRSRKPVRFEDERAGRHLLNFESPVFDTAGNVSRVAVFVLDITERKEAERALAQKEELYRTLFELSPDGILLEDSDGNILDVNQALCRSFGYAREQMVGRNVWCLVPPDGQAEVAKHLAALRSGQSLQHEIWNVRKSGERLLMWLNEKPLLLPDGRQGILVVARDITESKRAQLTKEVLLSLGADLGAAANPKEAARAVFAAADRLWQWDSASLDLYLPESDRIELVLSLDVVDGQRQEVGPASPAGAPSARMRRIMEKGAELILDSPAAPSAEFKTFGDTARLSASMMYAPLRREGRTVGVLSVQSYTPNTFTQEDLRTLQALADHCGAALDRIQASVALREAHDRLEQRVRERTAELQAVNTVLRESQERLSEAHDHLEQRVRERTAELEAVNAALQESEERHRSLVNNLNVGVFRTSPGPGGGFLQANPALARMHGFDSVEEFQNLRVAELYRDPRDRAGFLRRVTRQGAVLNYEVELKKRDGTPIYGSLSAAVHRDETGKVDWIDGVVEDITQRKEAEAALREHENRFRAVFESSSDCILVWDRQYNYLYANQAAIDHVGTTRDKVIGQNIRSGLGHLPAFMRLWMGRVDRAFATGESFRVQDAVPVGDQLVFSESQISPIRDAAGRVFAVGVVYRDVSERKRAEQALAEALDLNQRILAASPMGIVVFKASGECVFANEALAVIVGGSLPELLQLNFRRLPAWRKGGLLQMAEATLAQNQPITREVHSYTTFGKEAWVDVHMAPFSRSGQEHLLCMFSDISARKSAEAALREAERLPKAILDNIPDPAWLKDAKGRFLACNQALAAFHGKPAEYFLGKTMVEVRPEQAAHASREDREALTTRRPILVEKRLTDAQGVERWFESFKAPLFNAAGEVIGTVGIAREITERKRTELLLQAQRDLGVGLSLAGDLPAALEHLLDLTMQMGGIDAAGVYLTDAADDCLELVAHQGVSPAYVSAAARWKPERAVLQPLQRGQAIFRSFSETLLANNPVLQREGLRATALIPMCHGGGAIGALAVASRVADDIPSQTRLVIEAIAAQAAGAIARIRAETERRYLERQVLEISDRQQARMGQEIHDGLCQHLVSLAFDANSLRRALSGRRQPEAKTARRIARYLDQAITEARQLSRGLFPVRLAEVGLPPALEDLARTAAARFKLRCRFAARGHVVVADNTTATHLYRIAQEALTNAIKHSQARSVSIRLLASAGRLELTIEDDGRGLPSGRQRNAPGLGLHIMAYRARSIGGTLRLRRGRRGGTVVSCCVPRRRGARISA